MYPDDRRYTRDHVWARRENGGWRVGISEHLARQLTWVTAVRLPRPGARVERARELASIEATKVTWSVPAPFAGLVLSVNGPLSRRLERMQDLKRDPYGEGWLVVLVPDDPGDPEQLLDASAYAVHAAGSDGGAPG